MAMKRMRDLGNHSMNSRGVRVRVDESYVDDDDVRLVYQLMRLNRTMWR